MLAATAFCLAALAQGGPEVLRGIVVERGTGRPLAGVSVRFDRLPTLPGSQAPGDGKPGPPAGGPTAPRWRIGRSW